MNPLIRCPHCGEHIEPQRLPPQRKYRNEFGLDVFECPDCGQNFKFDPHEYFAVRGDIAMGEGVAIAGARVDELLPSEKLAIQTTKPKRYVPLLIGLGALLASGWLIIGFEGWSRYLLGVPLLAFGWVSLKTAFFASDREIRKLTNGRGSHPPPERV